MGAGSGKQRRAQAATTFRWDEVDVSDLHKLAMRDVSRGVAAQSEMIKEARLRIKSGMRLEILNEFQPPDEVGVPKLKAGAIGNVSKVGPSGIIRATFNDDVSYGFRLDDEFKIYQPVWYTPDHSIDVEKVEF